jgi:hypothetical protein
MSGSPVAAHHGGRRDDAGPLRILILSTPRSGNTWCRRLLADALRLDQAAVHHPAELSSDELPSRVVIQLHWPCHSDIRALVSAADAVVTLFRHPLDVLVSIVHFAQFSPLTALWLQGAGGNEEALVGANPNDRLVVEYARSDRFKNLLAISHQWREHGIAVRYEDLVGNPVACLESVVSAIAAGGAELEVAVAANAFVHLHETDPIHHPRGVPGGWRRFLTTATADALAACLGESYLRSSGYDARANPALDEVEATRRWNVSLQAVGRAPVLDASSRMASVVSYIRHLNDGRAQGQRETAMRSRYRAATDRDQ